MKHEISAAHIKPARLLLGWDVRQLASAAGLNAATVRRIEELPGPADRVKPSLLKIQRALERAGVDFAGAEDGRAFRLRTRPPTTE